MYKIILSRCLCAIVIFCTITEVAAVKNRPDGNTKPTQPKRSPRNKCDARGDFESSRPTTITNVHQPSTGSLRGSTEWGVWPGQTVYAQQ